MILTIYANSNKHLKKVCMNYFEHFCLSMYFSGNLLIASIQAFIHAWVPCWYNSTTTDLVSNFQNVIKMVGCKKSYKS